MSAFFLWFGMALVYVVGAFWSLDFGVAVTVLAGVLTGFFAGFTLAMSGKGEGEAR